MALADTTKPQVPDTPRIPYVIDNQRHVLARVLGDVLARHAGRSLDVATAYFTVGGFRLIQGGLANLGSFRLLLGAEPKSGEQVGLAAPEGSIGHGARALLRRDLDALPFDAETLRAVEQLIALLSRESSQVRLYERGFLHAKCWLFYSDRPITGALDRFHPLLAVVGSSNFTGPGLTSNRELNLAHKVLLDPAEADDPVGEEAVQWLVGEKEDDAAGAARMASGAKQLLKSEVGARAMLDLETWYHERWGEARDFKRELIELLDASKFGEKAYTPYQVYMKALFEYFQEDLADGSLPVALRSAVELTEFQDDAVKKARKILLRHHGVLIADSVGLGKTWIGKKLLEDYAYHQRLKAVVICPASLRENWKRELTSATIAARVLSQEELGREEFETRPYRDVDVVLVDESHNFRNPNTHRYANLERILGGHGRRGRAGGRKKIILLTATPINNDLFDLYHQIALIAIGDRGHFLASGIGDLYRYFQDARRQARRLLGLGGDDRPRGGVSSAIFNLLEEVVIRRTRPFIRRAYPEATLGGRLIHFPARRLRTVTYDLETTYSGIYDRVVSGVERLRLAPYNLESYTHSDVERDTFEVGREQALVGIFKSRYLKRFESSIEAFRISVRRALEFLQTFDAYASAGRLLASSDFHRAMRYLEREGEEDDVTPGSRSEVLDASAQAAEALEELDELDAERYDLERLHRDVRHDVEILRDLWDQVRAIRPENDAKLQRLEEILQGELRGKKVLVFSYYKDTVRYLYRNLGHPDSPRAQAFRQSLDGVTLRRMDSGADPKERLRLVQGFAPRANDRPEWAGSEREIDILFSTDVLSEGHNLQDCGHLLNYDLHWNPTRMVQRAGRIDRIGSPHDTLWIYNMFPEEGLERLLRLVQSLNVKISYIDQAGFHDASILGESAHPQDFNTLRRIRDEDDAVIEEEEDLLDLASSDSLAQQLRQFLESEGRDVVDDLPDGIHSGLVRSRAKGVFFYFQAGQPGAGGDLRHFWRYVDLQEERILDNRQLIATLIACSPDTPRVVDPALWSRIFDLQEEVIEDILQSVIERKALEVAPRSVEPVQQTVATVLQSALHHPAIDRQTAIEAIRYLAQPMVRAEIRALRQEVRAYQKQGDVAALLASVGDLRSAALGPDNSVVTELGERRGSAEALRREDLRLICFDLVTGG